MNCKFCGKKIGFFEPRHKICKTENEEFILKLKNILIEYDNKDLDSSIIKARLIETVANNFKYKNYLAYNLFRKNDIRTNETLLYIETSINIAESKNRKQMVRSGYRYERVPVWSPANYLIGKYVSIAFTDKSLYLLLEKGTMIYEYKKNVNLGLDEKSGYLYFDIKTTSPYPHRFSIIPTIANDKEKMQTLYLLLKCLSNYKV